jgi:hypothetical protein
MEVLLVARRASYTCYTEQYPCQAGPNKEFEELQEFRIENLRLTVKASGISPIAKAWQAIGSSCGAG